MGNYILRFISFIDPKDRLTFNPIHMILFIIVALPIINLGWGFNPYMMFIITILLLLQTFLFILKLLVKESYKKEFAEIKNSIPDLNLFHIFVFLLIAFPVLIYAGSIFLSLIFKIISLFNVVNN